MTILNETELRRRLKSGNVESYLFYGDEDYLKINAVNLASEAVCPDPSFSIFNIIKIDALNYDPDMLLDTLVQPPMMAEKKLIILSGFDFNSMRSSETDTLCAVLEQLPSYDYASLIISVPSGFIDQGYSASKPSEIINRLGKFLIPVRFDRITPQKLCAWAMRHFAHGGVTISEKDVAFLIDFCGTGMFKLANEIDKLCAFALYNERTEINADDIKNVCIADTEFDTFALSDAIMEDRSTDALSVLDYLKFKQTDPLIIFGEISKIFCDMLMIKRLTDDGMSPSDIGKAKVMNEYRAKLFAKKASKVSYEKLYKKISLCCEADRRLKLSSKDYSAIEMLFCSD